MSHETTADGVDFSSVAELEMLARTTLPTAGFDYHFGSDGNSSWNALSANLGAFRRLRFRGRVLTGVESPVLASTLLGTESPSPVLLAPVGGQQRFHPRGELAMGRAAAACGTVMGLSTLSSFTVEETRAEAPGATLWFQLYLLRDRHVTQELVERAEKAGYEAIILTVDNITGARQYHERAVQHGVSDMSSIVWPSLDPERRWANLGRYVGTSHEVPQRFSDAVETRATWTDVGWLRSITTLPIVLKGVQTAEDAVLAYEHGAAGVVVSNHGGVPPALDGLAASLDALPEVAEAVGDRLDVYLDGGVRSGGDVLKALALGARAVFIGRPAVWALAVGGEAGVKRLLDVLHDELRSLMALTGVASVRDVPRGIVNGGPRWD